MKFDKLLYLPCILYFMFVAIWINGMMEIFFETYEISTMTIWTFRMLAVYTIFLILIHYFYSTITEAIKEQKEIKKHLKK